MTHFSDLHHVYDEPVKLLPEEVENPTRVFREVFADCSLSKLRDHLGNMGLVCMTTDNVPFKEPENRADLLYYNGMLERMAEAGLVLARMFEKTQECDHYDLTH